MNKKFLSAILFGALMITSTGTFVSCKDYDDDIDQINTELAGLKGQIEALQAKINSGEWVSGVTSTADGITVTLGNGQTFNIKNGKDGANGAAGKNGSVVTIDPTTSNWLIDGVDTGVCAKGQSGQAPRINEEGNWEVWNGEAWVDTEMSAIGAQTYVIEYPSYFELNVMEQDAEGANVGFVKINLPKTAAITDLKAVTITDGKIDDAVVNLNYGVTIGDTDFKFNNVNYKKSTLIAAGSSLSAIVNPQDADASVYEFALVDSKGNAPYVISNVKANATEAALSRAATVNQGVWDMSVAYAAGVDFTKAEARSAVSYALKTTTSAGVIASAYDVEVKENYVSKINSVSLQNTLTAKVTESIDLSKVFKKDNVAYFEGKIFGIIPTRDYINDLTPYIVDYYFTIADKTTAAKYGIELNGDILTAAKPVSNVEIKVNYLLIDGTKVEGTTATTIKANFTYVAPTAELSDVTWTINNQNAKVYLPISAIKSSLVANKDNQLPSFAKTTTIWADGKAFNEKTIEVNGVKYGKGETAMNDAWIVKSVAAAPYTLNAQGKYVAATSIEQDLYIEFTFDYTVAMPGEYTVTLNLNKYGETNVTTLSVPVNVTIVAPEQTIVKHENYFTGNDAVAYGAKNAEGTISYNLNELFKTTGLAFAETEVKKADGVTKYAKWLQSGSTIKVGTYQYGNNVDNGDRVYATREYTATICPFGNTHIQATAYTFNLTIKSAIKEGTFTSEASKTIETSQAVKFDVTEFNGVDVYGDKFQIGETYEYDKNGNLTKVNKKDARIVKVEIAAADDNAKEYLNITTFNGTFGNAEGEKPAAEYFTVARKTELTQLVEDTPCTIKVTITDDWGVKSEATVSVVLKKF